MLRVATFNAGLAVGVLPHVTERLPHILAELKSAAVDLLFVQEFWLDSHWEQLHRSVHARLPYTLRPSPRAGRAGGCAPEQLEPLRRCAELHCAALRDEALARCVVRHCAPLALALPDECLNCIASNPTGTLDEIFERCTAAADQRELEAPIASRPRRGLTAYGGSFGTGLLSRFAPSATDSIAFRASLNARGALWAKLETPDLGLLHVFATHLSPDGAEQEPQVERLLAWIEQKAGADAALLLGDLNTTPSSPAFRRFEKAGFDSGAAADRARGTFSSEGLLSGHFGESGWRLDHVLVRGSGLSVRTQRFLDDRVLLQTAEGTRASTLSDHAGLLATVFRVE